MAQIYNKITCTLKGAIKFRTVETEYVSAQCRCLEIAINPTILTQFIFFLQHSVWGFKYYEYEIL